MHSTSPKIFVAALGAIACASLLSGCSEAAFGSSASSAIQVQQDTFHSAERINKALAGGATVREVTADAKQYVKLANSAEQYSLRAGSCGASGPKAYALVVSDGSYTYTYQSRSKVFRGGYDQTATRLLELGCGAFS